VAGIAGAARVSEVFGTGAFAQFSHPVKMPVDLMVVSLSTWQKFQEEARTFDLTGTTIALPAARHFVARKLHAANSTVRSKSAQDWEDIFQLIRLQHLDPHESAFQTLILRYGGQSSLTRLLEAFDGNGSLD